MYRLLFQGRLATRGPLTVREPRLWLGRDPTCQVQLSENGVSDRHATIERREDGYYVCDLQSTAGLRVNGQPVTQQRLRSGDEIELGAARLRFEVAHDTPTPQRKHDTLLIVTAALVVLLIVGQLALLAWIFRQPRPAGIVGRKTVETPAAPQITPEPVVAAPAVTAPAPVTAPPPKPIVLNRQLRIGKITDSSDAVVTIPIRAQVGDREMDNKEVAIVVHFFVRGADGKLSPWPLPVRLAVAGFNNFANKTFTAKFPGAPSQYAGCVVRTYYRGQLQDVAATTLELLAHTPGSERPQ